jgi:hypothetical protein
MYTTANAFFVFLRYIQSTSLFLCRVKKTIGAKRHHGARDEVDCVKKMGHGPFRGLGLLLLLRIIYHKRRRRRRRLLTRTAAAANTIHLDGRFPFLLPLPFSRFYFSLHSVSTN